MIKILETSRLLLREFESHDAQKMWELNNDYDVIKYTGDFSFTSVDQAKLFLENYTDYHRNGYGRWVVILKNTNEFIGWCGLKLNKDSTIDIGFRFFKKCWNKGYATESATACLQYGFNHLKLAEIIGRASIHNNSSIKVLEKIHMKYWKTEIFSNLGNSVFYKLNNNDYSNEN